ncbi:MAG: methylenetetrahydrofolate--tRNA-(uracil(54)-C(5))-methyltransferase (FADH(2)-oxidizing) TrmFO [Anaerolineaceae bacterium]|nr:methylenetetrahydrofolate--tRNA-(uracil(54)-C(5))-methyltransferase (FADH(2)-oxidizing) TrmFO [Anaerolineaceae bacterium]
MTAVTVIGGGLAGSEAAWQLAERGLHVNLYEMRPQRSTGAHVSDQLAELVCSNSLGSKLHDRASGLLQAELTLFRSLLLDCARRTAVSAGGALAVDREGFSNLVTRILQTHPNLTIIRQEVTVLGPEPTIIATGPLTSVALSEQLGNLTGQAYLHFYDAISPIVKADSIDMDVAFSASRYGRGDQEEGDYINCPMNEAEYQRFVSAVRAAETIPLRNFEQDDPHFFEACVPIEQLAARGDNTLAYGPMRPVGLRDPRTGNRPHAVVQLRRDNTAGTLYNIVGFQTNMRWTEQRDVLRLIPGLEQAEFIRMGQMHRNTFINSPTLLLPTLQFRTRDNLFFAGQLTGIEGYLGNIATGLLAGVNMSRHLIGQSPLILPEVTMLGALCHYITHTEPKHFQPMKANFGILPELVNPVKNKQERYRAYVERGIDHLRESILHVRDRYLS